MTDDAVDTIRRLYQTYNDGDYATAFALLHPEAEMHQAVEIPDSGVYRGREAFASGLARWTDEWETFRFEPQEMRGAPGGEVLAHIKLVGTAKRTGIPIDREVWHAWTVRDGLGFRCRVFFDRDAALAAVGLGG
jgi:ketosteroid isomerase-like protein